MGHPDLTPAARRMAELIRNVGDDQLQGPTPCPDYTLGDLIDHVSGFSIGLAATATKTRDPGTAGGPSGDATRLGDDWRTRIAEQLDALATAWADPDAWTGTARAGTVDLPAEVGGLVALDELVVHGWDVARASGQPYDAAEEDLEAIRPILGQFGGNPDGPFGVPVPVPDDAPLLDQVVGLAGRDPSWRPTS